MTRVSTVARSMAVRRSVTFLATYAVGLLCFSLPAMRSGIIVPFLPAGMAVAATYRWGRSQWLPIWAAGAAVMLGIGRPWWEVLSGGTGLAAGALAAAYLLTRLDFDSGFSRAKDVVVLLLAVLLGMALASTVGVVGFLLAGIPPQSTEQLRWLRLWSEVAGGAVLLAPPLLAINQQRLAPFREHWLDAACWTVGVVLCCAVVAEFPGPAGRSMVVMASFLLIVVGAVRFGVVPSSFAAVVISCSMAWSLGIGTGLFGGIEELGGRLTLFVFSTTLIAASLIVSVVLAERDAAAVERRRAERLYAQIFDGSPQAIWVHDPVHQTFLLANEAAQRQYGWSQEEFLGKRISALAPPGEQLVLPTHDRKADSGYTAPIETRHMTKDGRIFEVEVWMQPIDFGGLAAELVFAADVSERRALGRALIEGLVGEQRRIASEIHDGLGQELTGLALSLRALATRASRNHQPEAADLDALAKLAAHCIEGAKNIVQGLSPLQDAGGDLESALDLLARRASLSGTPVHFRAVGAAPPAVQAEALDHFYRIAQEAVQNALKHAEAAAIDIELCTSESDMRLSVSDDGRGLPTDLSSRQGLGMRTMQFRAIAIGGALVLEPRHGGGTAVSCAAPLAIARA